MEHQQYITTRDTYRIDRDLEFKWTGTHNGFISDVWKMPSISLCKRASINRFIYDKGWHGGNRAKATCLSDKDREEWIGCGDCGHPDSQYHWLRECNHEEARAIRKLTLYQADMHVQDILKQKGSFQETRDIFNLCSEILHFAENLLGGEQVWLGIVLYLRYCWTLLHHDYLSVPSVLVARPPIDGGELLSNYFVPLQKDLRLSGKGRRNTGETCYPTFARNKQSLIV